MCRKAASEAINSEDIIQAQVQVRFSACFSTATCTVICMSIYIQMDMCVCQRVYISLLLLGFTRRQPACFGSTLRSHILALWSVTPADVGPEVNGVTGLDAETTNTSEHMGWCYFYNPLQQKLMVDKVQATAEVAKLRRSYKIQFIWGFKALKRKERPPFALLGPSYFLCNTENYCKYYHLSVGTFSVASWLRQKHRVFLRTESPELLQCASL